jgi:MoaA/NifB/PqqE/SkfB family radical SAM enzyme
MKSLVHSAHYEAILKGKPLNPIVVNFDMTNKCNYKCRFCMFGGRKRADKTSEIFRNDNSELNSFHIKKLPKLWKRWGIKAECVGGGGEPTMHPYCFDHLLDSHKQGIDIGFVSNGFLVNNERKWNIVIKTCKWVGFSIDAGNEETYSAVKGVPKCQFNTVINNIRGLVKTKEKMKSKCNIGFKFLLDEENYQTIYQAAKLAKEIGCNTFQFRPAINIDYHFDMGQIEMIKQQINRAQKELDCDNFKVFGVTHKFNSDFSKKHDFKKCRATMLTTTWCADGKVYMCTDSRGNPWAYLCDHYPNPEKVIKYWGSKDHFKKVKKINFKKNCDRCTLEMPNQFFEKVFIQDKMERFLV